ncbi:hypothetical protein GA0070616_1361 [Micromonospora nigra]|uniref:Uncharacterized protein n=1 Tax=Micromonospora nigra TaxID=145857 RepID=A0A1C6RL14_9ACTN|nr:hypothetical protein [Micromonospora nigra]SCL17798.1 hypothetical protein GA0070616_1361 [Micromonospora nigra]
MRIRLNGTAEQVSATADLLRQVLPNTQVSRPYLNRTGGDVRVYLTCDPIPSQSGFPAYVLTVAEKLRAQALDAAGPAGVDMPAELVRLADHIAVGGDWQQVDGIEVDGWAQPGQPDAVRIGTSTHQYADDFHPFRIGEPVKVRRTTTGDSR